MSFYYLATPYSKYEGGIEAAFEMACQATAELIRRKIPVYSPIAHTHPIAVHGGIDPLDHGIWLLADQPMMKAASALIVWKAEGWRESRGITHEIAEFASDGKPIVMIDPENAAEEIERKLKAAA
jgi:hypothetical protein